MGLPISVYRENDLIIDYTVEDSNGTAYDLSGASEVRFVVSWNNEIFIDKTLGDGVTITSAGLGEVEVHLVAADTNISAGVYTAELVIVDQQAQRLVADQSDFVVEHSLTYTP